jgi:HJR/Mrr/RecB family endonuclease
MWIIAFTIRFIKRAIESGRIIELLISGILLGGTYFLLFPLMRGTFWWVLLIPLGVFSLYWHYLFSHEKITCTEADPNWADRNWWWNLDGWEFEEEAAKVFRLNGYKAEVTKKTGDGGIDILMYKDDKKIIVQCKHYTSPVAVAVARELNGLKDDFRADELILVASSGVTKVCVDFIKNKPYFKIYDLEDIIRMGLRPSYSV